MKLKRFDTAMWVLSLGGLLILVAYYGATAHFGVDVPFEVALLGVGLAFFVSILLFARWMCDLVGFVMKKEYVAAVMMLLLGLFVFRGFWL